MAAFELLEWAVELAFAAVEECRLHCVEPSPALSIRQQRRVQTLGNAFLRYNQAGTGTVVVASFVQDLFSYLMASEEDERSMANPEMQNRSVRFVPLLKLLPWVRGGDLVEVPEEGAGLRAGW